ncbi:MAG: hypothetical protein ACT4PT_11325 [Methanobacteriota archaeon]
MAVTQRTLREYQADEPREVVCERVVAAVAPGRPVSVRFKPYAGVSITVRERRGVLEFSFSDALSDAPVTIWESAARILLSKLARRRAPKEVERAFREYLGTPRMRARQEGLRRARGRIRDEGPMLAGIDLRDRFDALNAPYFGGRLRRPRITITPTKARSLLGRYDSAHDTIFVSRVLEGAPMAVVDYLLHHEMLHMVHEPTANGTRRHVHTRAFREDEQKFRQREEALAWLKKKRLD